MQELWDSRCQDFGRGTYSPSISSEGRCGYDTFNVCDFVFCHFLEHWSTVTSEIWSIGRSARSSEPAQQAYRFCGGGVQAVHGHLETIFNQSKYQGTFSY